jgi:polysaccharide biosynthesis transport protein
MGLQKLIGVMRNRAWIVVATVVVVTLVAVGVSLLSSRTYAGQTTVLLTQQNAGTALLGSPQPYQTDLALQRDVQTQVNVMRSAVILQPVIDALGLDTTPKQLAKSVAVKFDGQTNLVTIDVEDSSPDKAANVANAIATTYVAWSQEQQRASIHAAASDVQTRLDAAQKQIVAVQAEINGGDKSGATQVRLQAANDLYATLSEKLEGLKINEQLSMGAGSVLTSATPNPAPVSPKPVRNGALALALGLVLGLGIAFVTEALDNTIKTPEECEEIFGVPVLCSIPVERHKKDGPPTLALDAQPGGAVAEAYRVLRNNLGFIDFEHDIKAVMVTSALPNEGKSTVAANLSAVLALSGKRVSLVGCDFHQPGSAEFFDVGRTFGLSDVLRGEISMSTAPEQPKNFENLWVVSAGRRPPNPSELLGSATMQKTVEALRLSYDWVILDSAPLLVVADAAATVPWVDGVLVVVQAKVSTREAAQKAAGQLRNVGARVLGVVFWGLEDSAARGGYSDYGASANGQ